MTGRLGLSGRTLNLLLTLIPGGHIADELRRVRDSDVGGRLSTTEVRELAHVVTVAVAQATRDADRAAVTAAAEDLRSALRRVDLDGLELARQHHVRLLRRDATGDLEPIAGVARPRDVDQIVLRDITWRVACAVAPDHRIGREIARARDPCDGGHLAIPRLRELIAAFHRPCTLLDRKALIQARDEFTLAVARVDLDALATEGRPVSLFLWDEERDGPEGAVEHPPS